MEDELYDSQTGEKVKKVVFYVAYIGQQIGRRVEKMCDFFRASRYEVPHTPEACDLELHDISVKIQEKRQVLDMTQAQIVSLLQRVAFDAPAKAISPLRNYLEAMRREKIICDGIKKCHCPDASSIVSSPRGALCPVRCSFVSVIVLICVCIYVCMYVRVCVCVCVCSTDYC